MSATLRQIAEHSGVSIQTVSRILRGEQARHHPQTCERVMAAANALNYRPNLLGRALQSGRSQTVGLLRLGVGDHAQAMNLYGMSAQAKSKGYQLLVTIEDTYRNDGDKDFLRTLDDLIGRRVDGLIVHRSVPLTPAARRYMQSLDVPIVHVSWAPPKQAHHVLVNRVHGMKQVVAHLKSLGHHRLAFFPSPGAMDFPGHHMQPLQRVCNDAGVVLDTVPPDPRFAKMTASETWTHDSVSRYISHSTDGQHVTAMICPGNYGVQGALIALAQAGLSVPGDVSVVALDDSALGELSRPAVTALQCDWEAFGRLVFSTLHDIILEPQKPPAQYLVEPKLVIRSSTGPVSAIAHQQSDK